MTAAKLSLSANLRLTLIAFTLFGISTMNDCQAQIPEDLDISNYVPNELIVWFHNGQLNLEMLGGYGEMPEYPYSDDGKEPLPLDTSFISSLPLVEFLEGRGVIEITKVLPWIDPFCDTLSITRRGDTIRVPSLWNIVLLKYDPDVEADMVYEAYLLMAQFYNVIKIAQPNFKYQPAYSISKKSNKHGKYFKATTVNDSLFSYQASLTNSLEGIYIEDAWNYNTGGPNIKIGIVDDGIFENNPDFKDKIAVNKEYGVGKRNTHGTDMSGIIGARRDNLVGCAGIAGGSESEIGPMLYMLDAFTVADTTYHSSDIYNALLEATLNTTTGKGFGCNTINLSLFSINRSFETRYGVAYAYGHGVNVNAAMGNIGTSDTLYPGALDQHFVVAVGAKGADTNKLASSSYGGWMDLMGPGYGDDIYTVINDSSWYYSGGQTSAACAHTTGVAALVITEYNNSGSNIDKPYYPEDVENILIAGCVDGVGQIKGYHDSLRGWGYLNASNSLGMMEPPITLRHYVDSIQIQQYPSVHVSLPPNYATQFHDILDQNGFDSTFMMNSVDCYKLTKTVSYPSAYNSVIRAWGIGNQNWNREGFHPPRVVKLRTLYYTEEILQIGYTNVSSYGKNSCEVETYFYKGTDFNTGLERWVPFDPLEAKVMVYYSVLGEVLPVSTEESESISSRLLLSDVYPNPAIRTISDGLNVVFSSAYPEQEVELSVVTPLGRVVYAKTLYTNSGANGMYRIDVSTLTSGVYILSLSSNGATINKHIAIIN